MGVRVGFLVMDCFRHVSNRVLFVPTDGCVACCLNALYHLFCVVLVHCVVFAHFGSPK